MCVGWLWSHGWSSGRGLVGGPWMEVRMYGVAGNAMSLWRARATELTRVHVCCARGEVQIKGIV